MIKYSKTVMRNIVCLVVGHWYVFLNCVQGEFLVLPFHIACSSFLPTVRKCFDMPTLTLYKIMNLIEE